MSTQGDLFERAREAAPEPDDGLVVCPECGGWSLMYRSAGLLLAAACATCGGAGDVPREQSATASEGPAA